MMAGSDLQNYPRKEDNRIKEPRDLLFPPELKPDHQDQASNNTELKDPLMEQRVEHLLGISIRELLHRHGSGCRLMRGI